MRRLELLIITMLALAGCSEKPATAPAANPPAEQAQLGAAGPATAPEESAGTITARLFRRDSADGELVGPSLEVYSPNASELEPGVMNFRDARVTIFAEDDQKTVITAKNGILDQNKETAELTEEVEVRMGTQTLWMDQLSWNNEKREAAAQTGVRIVDGDTELKAEAMRFLPDENMLVLERVTGKIRLPQTAPAQEAQRGAWRTVAMWVIMATPAYAQAAGGNQYTHVVIEKPAPEVIFRDNRLEQMTGGVEIQLKSAVENDPPLLLGADAIVFGWTEDESSELASLDMKGNVSVSNAGGDMRASDAAFDVTKMTIAFTGGVEGRFEGIDEFQADRLDYNIESGDMEMQNLRAIIPFANAEGGDAGSFSQMEVRRAANVRIAGNRVQDMSGGVGVLLTPQDGKSKPIALGAEEFGFTYANAEQRQPDAVSMKGGVRVDAPQGLIQSDSANFGVSSGLLKFRGNVRGRSDMLNSFRASSFDYDLDTEDGVLRSFRADGVKIGADGGYDRMDVRTAPEVRMEGGRVTNMSGGVEIKMEGDKERGPLMANAQTVDIQYESASATAPRAVNMKDDVHVITGEIDIHANTADLNMADEVVEFAGRFRADLPRMKGVTGSHARYDLKTGNFKLLDGYVPEIEKPESVESQEQP